MQEQTEGVYPDLKGRLPILEFASMPDGILDEHDLEARADAGPKPKRKPSPEEVEAERETLLNAVSAGKFDTVQEKVAWILNHHPRTRNSDIHLQVAYWEEFESDLAGGDSIRKEDLFRLTRAGSLVRARAKIQNGYGLFKASLEVQQRRGKLSEDERAKAAEQRQQADYPVLRVHTDESGKDGGKCLIVGSLWFLHAPEAFPFIKATNAFKAQRGFDREFHFQEITEQSLPHYMAFVDFMLDRTPVISFKAISVARAGVRRVDEALDELQYHLLVRGIEHEHETGRVALPRTLQLYKDLEEEGRDKLSLAKLKDRIDAASLTKFDSRLVTEEFRAVVSKGNIFVQAADLYVSSLNRVVNGEGKDGPKDRFARHFLDRLGVPHGPAVEDAVGDMAIHISL